MKEEQFNRPETYDSIKGLRNFIGIALIVIGVIIAAWVIINVYSIVTNPYHLEVFKQIIPDRDEIRELDINGKKVVLPKGVFHFMSYLIGIFLFSLAVSIAVTLIKGGVDLLMSSFQKLELKITKEIGSLKRKIDETKNLIKKKSDFD